MNTVVGTLLGVEYRTTIVLAQHLGIPAALGIALMTAVSPHSISPLLMY